MFLFKDHGRSHGRILEAIIGSCSDLAAESLFVRQKNILFYP